MPITGVILRTDPSLLPQVLNCLRARKGITVHAHNGTTDIVATIDTTTVRELEAMVGHLPGEVPGVLAVLPSCMIYDVDEESSGQPYD